MANAAISGENYADAGTVSGRQVDDMPVSNLLDPHVENRWRAPSNNEPAVFDLGSAKSIDIIMLRGLTAGENLVARIRVSSADSSGLAGDVLDTGDIENGDPYLDVEYGNLCYVLSSPLTGRYVRIDLNDPDADYVEAGRAHIGPLTSFTYNMSYGWQFGHVDRSTVQKSRGGQSLIWRDNCYRVLDFSLRFVTTTQRYGIVETIDRRNGRHTDVVVVTDTDSDNLARDTVHGLVSELTPVTQPDAVFDTDGPLFSKQYKIEERL